MPGWEWDETLYAGSAVHYAVGRLPYPSMLADVVQDVLKLDGTGRLLDVGCGPGSLTLLLAPGFQATVGIDADAAMVAEAARRARRIGRPAVTGIRWRQMRAEDLPADLGTFRAVVFAQSFHWMDRERVAPQVHQMLEPRGRWLHVSATTHRGVSGDDPLPYPRPPWSRVDELVSSYLGPVRRAGKGTLPAGTPGGEEDVMRRAGFTLADRVQVGGDEIVVRDTDEIVSATYSLSSSTPHLFGDRLPAFEQDLRQLLEQTSDHGQFCERTREIELAIWHP